VNTIMNIRGFINCTDLFTNKATVHYSKKYFAPIQKFGSNGNASACTREVPR
jgi:hypothetical protein